MALSKAMKAPHLFVQTGAGTGQLTGSAASWTSSVNSSSTSVQWKVKELLFSRSASGSTDLKMYIKNRVSGVKFLMKEVLAFTSTYVRIAANLVDGEYYIDADSEISVESTGLGGGETWKLRLTGQVVGPSNS